MIKKTNKRSLFEKKFVPLHPKCGNMCSLESLKIDLKGLSEEETLLEFDLNDNYFEALDGAETKRGSLHVSVSIRKATGFFEFNFHTAGTVIIPCDRCLDDMEQSVETDNRLIVKLGSETSEEDDMIVVNEDEGILKLLAAEDGTILGCHVMGAHAADLVQEVAALMNFNATVQRLRDITHIHPTLGEILQSAAEMF